MKKFSFCTNCNEFMPYHFIRTISSTKYDETGKEFYIMKYHAVCDWCGTEVISSELINGDIKVMKDDF